MSNPTAEKTDRSGTGILGLVIRLLHPLFEASLLFKGLLALAEASAGLGLLLTTNRHIVDFANWLTRTELAQDAHDPMALWVRNAVQAFSIETQHFYALYLLSHGLLKLLMVGALARRVIWAYPASIAVLLGFVAYQMHRYSITHSPALLLLSGFDLFMTLLVWREFRLLRRQAE